MLLRSTSFCALAFTALTGCGSAQRHTSPPAQASIEIGSRKIQIDYYAPSMYGRKIMGGLVPFNEVWCTGANWATKITSDAPLDLGGLKLPAGSYSLWTIPNETEWTLIVNRQTGQFHLDYDPSRDFGRTKMSITKLETPVEKFKIQLSPSGGNRGILALAWEKTEASVPFRVLE